MHRTRLWIAGLAILWAVSAAAAQKAELHVNDPIPHGGDGGCCCWDFEVYQLFGTPGNITAIEAQVTTPGVTVTSGSGPLPGPAPSAPALLSARGFTVVGRSTIKITDPDVVLTGLRFAKGEAQTIRVRMQLRQGDNSRPGTTFNWDVIQSAPLRRGAPPTVIGGERYIFTVEKKVGRDQ